MARPTSAGFNSSTLAERFEDRSLQEAYDELDRELNVRLRCFDRWVQEGRVSASDATDRLQRLAKAVWALGALLDAPEEVRNTLLAPVQKPF